MSGELYESPSIEVLFIELEGMIASSDMPIDIGEPISNPIFG